MAQTKTPAPKKRRVYQSIERGEDGLPRLVYKDLETGEPVPYSEIGKYEIISADDTQYWKGLPTTQKPPEEKKTEGETVERSPNKSDKYTYRLEDDLKKEKSNLGPADNFGYTNKPDWMKHASKLPGVPGLIGKGVNAAVNFSNTQAVDKARDMMDVDPLTKGQKTKGTLFDQHGQIGNFNINGRTYGVGFEAMSPDGRTNLTPIEARSRAAWTNGINEVAPDKSPKLGGRLIDAVFEKERQSFPTPPNAKTYETLAKWENPINEQMAEQREVAQMTKARENVSWPSKEILDAQRSPGMAALAPKGINYAHTETRGPWDTNLQQGTKDVANRLAGTMGNMNMTSAYRSPEINQAVGGARMSAHTTGNAFDVSTRGMTDDEKQKAVEMGRLSGAKGIGNYTDGSLHFDMYNRGAYPEGMKNTIPTVDNTYGMYNRTANNAAINAPDWFVKGMTQDRFAPTPTPKPAFEAPKLDPLNTSSVFASLQPQQDSLARQQLKEAVNPVDPSDNRFQNKDVGQMSPAEFAAKGLTQRSPEQRDLIAQTLAGELSGEQLKALEANDPTARQELANMVASIENRAASAKYGTLEKALNPTQYNSLMTENMATTNNNFSLYGNVMKNAVGDFYTGNLNPTNYGHTSYYNPSVVKPSWGNKMQSPEQVGDHRFGALNSQYDYGPSQSFLDARTALSNVQKQETRGFLPERNYSGGGYSMNTSRYDTPSEKSGRGFMSKQETKGPSHSSERERDRSVSRTPSREIGKDRAPSNHDKERERDRSVEKSKGPTHSQERERDKSVSKDKSSKSSKDSNHSKERERDI